MSLPRPMGVVLEEDARRGRVVVGGFLEGSVAEKRAKVAAEVPPAWLFCSILKTCIVQLILVLFLRSSWLVITELALLCGGTQQMLCVEEILCEVW